jgi:hypothetical protein
VVPSQAKVKIIVEIEEVIGNRINNLVAEQMVVRDWMLQLEEEPVVKIIIEDKVRDIKQLVWEANNNLWLFLNQLFKLKDLRMEYRLDKMDLLL